MWGTAEEAQSTYLHQYQFWLWYDMYYFMGTQAVTANSNVSEQNGAGDDSVMPFTQLKRVHVYKETHCNLCQNNKLFCSNSNII